MIYYFTGTGNSRWVAERLALKLGDTAKSLVDTIPSTDGRLVVVCPVYAWSIPSIVEKFLEKLPKDHSQPFHLIVTCGDNVGKAIKRLNRRYPVHSAYSIAMPNNYIIGFGIDSPDVTRSKLTQAREDVERIAAEILDGEAVWRYEKGGLAWYLGGMVGTMFRRFGRSTKSFRVKATCISCGQCARECPVRTIHMREGKPVWNPGSCEMCLRCVHRCPVEAIEYGRSTVGKKRYHLEQYIAADEIE